VFDREVTTALRPIAFCHHYFLCVHSKDAPIVRVFDSIKTHHTAERNKLILKLCPGANAIDDADCPQQAPGSNDCGFHTAWNLARVLQVHLEPGRKALCDAVRARILQQQEMFADIILS
jgi:Ulp1 family protease